IRTSPDHLTGHYYLAKVLTDMKRYEEAEQSFKKTLSIKPTFEPALIDLGLLYEKEKKTDQAIELYRDFLDLYPPGTNVRIKLGEIFLRARKLDDAEREFKRILKLDNSNRDARLDLGLLYLEKGKFDDAIGEFDILLDGNPNDQRARYLLASTYEEKKMHGKAIEGFKMIPPDSELYGNAQINMGIILKREGRVAEAIELMERAIRNNRDMPELYIYLSSLYEEDKKLSSAEGILKEGLVVLPESIDLHYSLGVLYEKTNRLHESINEMESVLKIDPAHADALNFIGYTLADRGIRLDEAEKMIKKALMLKPGNVYMIDSLGWVYFRQNRMDLAIKYLKEASDGLPNDPTIAEHLGDAYAKAGRASEAAEIYRQALKLNPANGDLQKKLNDLIKGKKP
ncbi:MAG: tetratricopeptide repeat protein, partial [Syntrophales bacterium]